MCASDDRSTLLRLMHSDDRHGHLSRSTRLYSNHSPSAMSQMLVWYCIDQAILHTVYAIVSQATCCLWSDLVLDDCPPLPPRLPIINYTSFQLK